MRRVLLPIMLLCAISVRAQHNDSIQTKVLAELVISGVRIEADTLENFYKSNALNTTESILSRMTGMSLMRRGAYGQEPIIRGMSSGQINVTIDGMKIFGACTDKMDPVSIYVEPFNMRSIQAKTGVQASEFGSTFGGSVNMNLIEAIVGKASNSRKIGLDFQSAAKSTNFYTSLNAGRNNSGYQVNVTYRKNHNYTAGGGMEVLHSQYEKLNIAAAGKWAIKKYDTLQAHVLVDQGWNIGFPALPMDVGSATAGIYALTYQKHAPWWYLNRLKIKAYHNSIHHVMDDTHRESIAVHMDMPGRSSTTGAYAEGDVHLFHQHQTLVKLEYFSNTTLGEMNMYPEEGQPMYMQTAPQSTRNNSAVYLNQKFNINQQNKLYVTYRGDLITDKLHDGIGRNEVAVIGDVSSANGTRLVSSYGLIYSRTIANNMKLELQGGYGQRIPTLNERFGFYLFNRMDNYDYLGNVSLRPENSLVAEASINYFGPRLELQFTPFIKSLDHYIFGQVITDGTPMTIGARGIKQYTNLPTARMQGFEAMILAAPHVIMQWITTIKYIRGTIAGGESMPLLPPLKIVTSIRCAKSKFSIQIEGEWSAAQNNVSSSFGEVKTPSYFLANLRAGYTLNKQFSLNAGAENIFNRNYREHLDWGGIPRAGRNVYVNVTVRF